MRSLAALAALSAALSMTVAAVAATIDLQDFDTDVMQAMDDAFKDLEPSLGASNAEAATADVQVLIEGYRFTEDYFAAKGGASDAVQWSQEGRAQIDVIAAALSKQEFDSAAEAARALSKNCKACHQAYKTSLSR
jgi:cytochrome c556